MKSMIWASLLLISFNLYAGIVIPPLGEVLQRNNQSVEKVIYPNQSYDLLVWNIYKQAKEEFYRDEMFLKKFDFILFQEILQTERFDMLVKGFFADYVFATSFIDEAATGVGILSRVELSQVDFQRSSVREPVIKTPKMAVIGKMNIFKSSKKLMLISIHGINFVRNWAFRSQINEIVQKIKNHNGPLIWGGDFNTWNKSRLSYLNKKLAEINLKKVDLKNAKFIKKFMGKPLDHIYTRGVSKLSGEVLNKPQQSDHNPLLFKFSLK